ncbi:MAG TPA: DedA family protein [Chthoniobacterales bacterium]
METLHRLVDVLLHTNLYLGQLANQLGPWIYALLFAVVFCETGLVVTPFLPGDALLFSVGALAATESSLNLGLVILTLLVAAWAGDTVNYWIGASFGARLFTNPQSRVFSHKNLERTHAFYERHGAKTIILARYVPIIRTFAPFVAGMATMSYAKFIMYNLAGGALWVLSVTLLGFFFGGLPAVQHNFSLVVLAIIVISIAPPAVEFLKAWRMRSRA